MERSVSGGPSEQASPSQLCRLPRCPSPGKGTPTVGTYGKGPGVPEMPQEEGPDCLQRDQPRILRPSFQRRKEGGWPGGFCAIPDSSGFKDRSFSLLSECVRGPLGLEGTRVGGVPLGPPGPSIHLAPGHFS